MRTFRHAVALDERRVKFQANLWNRPDSEEQKLGLHPSPVVTLDLPNAHAKKKHTKDRPLQAMEREYSEEQSIPTDVEEVWLPTSHSI